jgi:hypothetical protein
VRPRRRRRRRSLVIVVSLFLLLVVLLGVAIVTRHRMEFGAGEPRNLAELNAYYPAVPDEENAALRLSTLLGSNQLIELKQFVENEVIAEDVGRRASYNSSPKSFEEVCALSQGGLSELHALLQIPGARFPLDFTLGEKMRLPHLAQIREAERWERSLSRHFAAAGNGEASFLHLCDAWRVPALLKNEPLTTSQLVRTACHGLALEATAGVFSRTSLTDEQLQTLAGLVIAERDETWFYRTLLGERCDWIGSATSGPMVLRVLQSMSEGAYSEYMGRLVAASKLPRDERERAVDAIERDLNGSKDGDRQLEMVRHWPAIQSLLALTGIEETFTRDLMQIDLVLAAIAIERYRVANGHAPESLDVLVPQYANKIPLDLFTGDPFIYRQQPDGYIVYSPHGFKDENEDNGGISRLDVEKGEPYDWPFKVSMEDAKKRDAELKERLAHPDLENGLDSQVPTPNERTSGEQ